MANSLVMRLRFSRPGGLIRNKTIGNQTTDKGRKQLKENTTLQNTLQDKPTTKFEPSQNVSSFYFRFYYIKSRYIIQKHTTVKKQKRENNCELVIIRKNYLRMSRVANSQSPD